MNLPRKRARCLVLAAALALAPAAYADGSPTPPSSASSSSSARAPRSAVQGVAVVGLGTGDAVPREETYALARAVYASALRPRGVDELRARVLAGDAPPPVTAPAIRELAELRASIHGADAASRRLLASVGREVNARALLVVTRDAPASSPAAVPPAPAADAGADGGPPPLPPPPAEPRTVARLFDVETGDFDAARYEPEAGSPTPWHATVQSVLARFPADTRSAETPAEPAPAVALGGESKGSKPFYLSPWFWGAIGGALLVGAFVFFAARDSNAGNVHLQMHVPR